MRLLLDRNGAALPVLDGLRGVAAMIVLVSHYSNDFGLWGGRLGQGAGQTGVMLFFVLSGFLMAHLHIARRFTPREVLSYALKRFARVYPAFVVAALAFQVHGVIQPGLTTLLRQALLIDPGISVLWTIRVEIVFYAAFIGLWLIHAACGARVVGLLIAAAILLLSSTDPGAMGMISLTARYFLMGVMSALLLPAWNAAAFTPVSRLALPLLCSLPLGFPLMARMLFHAQVQPWLNDAVAIQIFVVFNLCLRDRRWAAALLGSGVARGIGRVSYSLYLFQPFVLDVVHRRIWPHGGQFVSLSAAILLSLALARLSLSVLELPAQRAILKAGRIIFAGRAEAKASDG
jgi:peptidoglycan/LPS O-acetylase OafA/YrhL